GGCVDGKAVINSGPAQIQIVDLSSGDATYVNARAESVVIDRTRSRLIFAVPSTTMVRQFDIETGKESLIFRGRKDRLPTMGGFGHSSIAISPDSCWLAIATIAEQDKQSSWHDRFEVNVIALSKGASFQKRLLGIFDGTTTITGAGDHIAGPHLLWTDPSTLMMATPAKVPDQQPGIRAVGNQRIQVVSVNAATLKRTTICEVPASSWSPWFGNQLWRRADSQLMIRGIDTNYRIDVSEQEAVPDRSLSALFSTSGDKHRPMLLAVKHRLAKKVNRQEIFVSPDGKQAVWLAPVNNRHFGVVNVPKNLSWSDGGKPKKIATGQWTSSPMIWLRESDLE
ncbi:MAG: hypothetical protein AB8G99_14925, partial [Planctomycetaceae bacterium]